MRETITERSFDPKLRHQGRSHIGVWKGVALLFRQSSSQGVSSDSSFSISVITSNIGGGLYGGAGSRGGAEAGRAPLPFPGATRLLVKTFPLGANGRRNDQYSSPLDRRR